jgi:MFS family permease
VSIALWTDLFLYSLVVPILPFLLKDRLDLPPSQIQSCVSGLLATFAASSFGFSPVIGYISDLVSTRQAPFFLGLLALLGSTALFLLGQSLLVLFVARILQGLSAALVWTVGLVLCVEAVGTENLGKTMGGVCASVESMDFVLTALQIFGFVTVGNLLSPPLGGFVYDKTGNKGLFIVAFAVLLVDFILRALVIEPRIGERYESQVRSPAQPPAGQADDCFEERPPPSEETSRLLPGPKHSIASCSYKISPDLPTICHKIPILPCLADLRFLSSVFLTLVQATLLGSFDATVPTLAQEYYGLSSLHAGLLFLPLGITTLALGPIFGMCVDRFGTKVIAVSAYSYLSLILCLLRLVQPGESSQVLMYGGMLGACGIGMAGINSPAIVEASLIIENYYELNQSFFGHKKPYAQLYALNNMVFSAGLALGPELAGELKQRIGYGNMNAVLAAVCAVAALLSFRYIGGGRDRCALMM